jgi:hypothetical protein
MQYKRYAEMSMSELLWIYYDIPSMAEHQLMQWVRPDDSEEIDTDRFIYTSRKHIESAKQLLASYRSSYYMFVFHWLKKFYDPQSVVEGDFLHPQLLGMKPFAELTQKTLILCQELFSRSAALQQEFGNYQMMWLVFEVSNPASEIARMLMNPVVEGKGSSYQKIGRTIKFWEEIAQEVNPPLRQNVSEEEQAKQNKLVTETYHSIFYPAHLVYGHAAMEARECPHFDADYFKPWMELATTVNNLARTPQYSSPVILTDGSLVVPVKGHPLNKKRPPKKGFGKQ